MASTFHLGHPERAIKAFTQWRTSWLSPRSDLRRCDACCHGALRRWAGVFRHARSLGMVWCAVASGTVFTTSMIYAQMKTVPRWQHWTTPALFWRCRWRRRAAVGQGQVQRWSAGHRRRLQSLCVVHGDGACGVRHHDGNRHRPGSYRHGPRVRAAPYRHQLSDARVHPCGGPQARAAVARSSRWSGLCAAGSCCLLPFGHCSRCWRSSATSLACWRCAGCSFAQAEHVVGLYYGKR